MDKAGKSLYSFGPFKLDARKRLLLRNGEAVSLAPKALDLLVALVENRDRVLVKDDLMEKVWPDQIVEDANITVHMSALRKVLGERRNEHVYIVTIPGRGYRFIADVRELEGLTESEGESPFPPAAVEFAQEKAGLRTLATIPRTTIVRRRWMVTVFAALLVFSALGVSLVLRNKRQATAPKIKSLAVLPFKSINEEGRDEYLELGIADGLITRLSQTGQVVVRPISATRKYTGLDMDPLAAGRELRVEAVLDGSIHKSGDRVRVGARLVRVDDGKPIWAGQFDEKLVDVLALEESVSERLAAALNPTMTVNGKGARPQRETDNLEAYQLYLKGRYQMSYWTADGLLRAVESFQRAIEKDPQYALAYAGLADAQSKLGFGSGSKAPAEEFSSARAAATRALELDGSLAEVHVSLAEIALHYDWNWSEAERHYLRSLELDPNLATAHEGYSQYLVAMGRLDQALAEIDLAEQLDPVSLVIKMHKGLVLYLAGSHDQAIAAYRDALEIEPKFSGAHALLGWVYQKQKKYGDAIREFEEASRQDPSPSWRLASLAHVYALSGKRSDALKTLGQLKEMRNKSYVSPVYIAEIYTALGDQDRAFDWLKKAYEERDSGMVYLRMETAFEGLSRDSRFQELLRRMRLN